MKKLLALLSVVLLLVCVGCNSDKNDSSSNNNSAHMNVIKGKIIEIKDNNIILLQITQERGGYKVDDKVLIKYKKIYEIDGNDPDGKQTEITPVLQDEVGTQFWFKDVTKKDGYDYIQVRSVNKHIPQSDNK